MVQVDPTESLPPRIDLWIDELRHAVRADSMTDLGLHVLAQIEFEGRPGLVVVLDPLTIAADGKQRFQVLNALGGGEDPLRHVQPDKELLGIDRLRKKIVDSRADMAVSYRSRPTFAVSSTKYV